MPRACLERSPQSAPPYRIVDRPRTITRRALRRDGVRATVLISERVAMQYELLAGDRVLASQVEAAGAPVRQHVVLRPRLRITSRRLTLRITRAVTLTDRATRSYGLRVR